MLMYFSLIQSYVKVHYLLTLSIPREKSVVQLMIDDQEVFWRKSLWFLELLFSSKERLFKMSFI